MPADYQLVLQFELSLALMTLMNKVGHFSHLRA